MTGESTIGRFGSGREVRRIEDAGLLAGAGRFTDDFSLPSQTYLVFLRSPHAHARIVSIDAAEALAMPGVIAVLTGDDLAKAGVKPLPVTPMFKRPDGSPGGDAVASGACAGNRPLPERREHVVDADLQRLGLGTVDVDLEAQMVGVDRCCT